MTTLDNRFLKARSFGLAWQEAIAPQSSVIQEYQRATSDHLGATVRREAFLVRGANSLNTEDIFEYFSAYPPHHIEWINDDSCTLVYSSETDASSMFLNFLSKPFFQEANKDRHTISSAEVEDGELDDYAIDEILDYMEEHKDRADTKNTLKTSLSKTLSERVTSIFRSGPRKEGIGSLNVRYAVVSDKKSMDDDKKNTSYTNNRRSRFDVKYTNHFNDEENTANQSAKQFGKNLRKRGGVFARLGNRSEETSSNSDDSIEEMSDGSDSSPVKDSGREVMLRLSQDSSKTLYSDHEVKRTISKKPVTDLRDILRNRNRKVQAASFFKRRSRSPISSSTRKRLREIREEESIDLRRAQKFLSLKRNKTDIEDVSDASSNGDESASDSDSISDSSASSSEC